LVRCADDDVTDYTCAVLAAMTLFSGVNWVFYARKHYKGPRIELSSVGPSTYIFEMETMCFRLLRTFRPVRTAEYPPKRVAILLGSDLYSATARHGFSGNNILQSTLQPHLLDNKHSVLVIPIIILLPRNRIDTVLDALSLIPEFDSHS
ncbi:hypothetical protein KCU77_g40, partial [Aureobasidium melanogenum]